MNEKWMNPTACEGVPIRGDMAPDRVAQLMMNELNAVETEAARKEANDGN